MNISEQKQSLLDLMRDKDSFDKLSKWSNKINVFEILKISRMEIRHSNMLCWLLDPNESHGLGDSCLYSLLCKLSKGLGVDLSLKLLSSDLYSFRVLREWRNIDILIISDDNKVAIAIENKIGSHEHKGNDSEESQLKKYAKTVNKIYSNYSRVFVYLTPEGEEPTVENWVIVTYYDILEILQKLYEAKKSILKNEVNLLIKNYIENLKSNVIMDKELIKLCNSIYEKHKVALDLIYENRDDTSSQISNLCREIISKRDTLVLEDSNTKSYVRFRTNKLNEYYKGFDKNYFYYQFQIRPKDDYMILELVYHKGKNETLGQSLTDKMNATIKIIEQKNEQKNKQKNKQLEDNWEWKRVWSNKLDYLSSKNKDDIITFINNSIDAASAMEDNWQL